MSGSPDRLRTQEENEFALQEYYALLREDLNARTRNGELQAVPCTNGIAYVKTDVGNRQHIEAVYEFNSKVVIYPGDRVDFPGEPGSMSSYMSYTTPYVRTFKDITTIYFQVGNPLSMTQLDSSTFRARGLNTLSPGCKNLSAEEFVRTGKSDI